MRITYYGHSAYKIETGSASVLIDPFLTYNPLFAASGLTVADVQKGVTHVLITHGHMDHVGDAVAILKATGATLTANHEICTYLEKKGITNQSPGGTGGQIEAGEISIAFTQAQHSSSDDMGDVPVYLGNPNGLVIWSKSEPGKIVHHMGDTGVYSDMALVHEFYQPTIGIVPIGDRYTMGAKHAALACKRYFKFNTVFPCHYATFGVLAPNADEFVALMKGNDVRVPKAGETVTL